MLFQGQLVRPIDWFDLVMHGSPWVLLAAKVFLCRGGNSLFITAVREFSIIEYIKQPMLALITRQAIATESGFAFRESAFANL